MKINDVIVLLWIVFGVIAEGIIINYFYRLGQKSNYHKYSKYFEMVEKYKKRLTKTMDYMTAISQRANIYETELNKLFTAVEEITDEMANLDVSKLTAGEVKFRAIMIANAKVIERAEGMEKMHNEMESMSNKIDKIREAAEQ